METKPNTFGTAGIAFVLGSALFWTSCASVPPIPVRPGHLIPQPRPITSDVSLAATGHTFVLVALDGVRHQDIFEGVDRRLAASQNLSERELLSARELTPNLHALMDRGAVLGAPGSGAGIAASGPNFMSVPGYLEMLTGRRPTGCTNNACAQTTHSTIADDFSSSPGASPLDVAVIASWEGVGQAAARDPSRLTLSVGRHGGQTREALRYDAEASALLDAGEKAGPEPGHGDYRRDQETAAIALRYLKKLEPRFLFIGLGDTDEYAHRDDYRGYLRALGSADMVIGQVAATLGRLEREGKRTTLLVTTDHGRAADFSGHGGYAPESAKVWLVATGYGIDARGLVTSRGERHLADVAATFRALAGVGTAEPSSTALTELMPAADTRLSQNR